MENMKQDKEKLHKRFNQLMDEQKKSDYMAQKNEKTCEWVNGEKKKKKKKKNEGASEVANRQTNEG